MTYKIPCTTHSPAPPITVTSHLLLFYNIALYHSVLTTYDKLSILYPAPLVSLLSEDTSMFSLQVISTSTTCLETSFPRYFELLTFFKSFMILSKVANLDYNYSLSTSSSSLFFSVAPSSNHYSFMCQFCLSQVKSMKARVFCSCFFTHCFIINFQNNG